MKLSIIIVVQEEEVDAPQTRIAIASAQFADEVLVVPVQYPISDFSEVRNRALKRAKGEWVLFLDSDELISPKLASEIKENIQSDCSKLQVKGYRLKRRDHFLGKWLEYGETAHVKLIRLAKKGAGTWLRPVHEIWNVHGQIAVLQNPLLHYSHETVNQMFEKIDFYSTLEAKYSKEKIKRLTGRMARVFILAQMIVFPAGKFVQNYFFRCGFLDGIPGFIHAMMMSFHSFLVRGKMLGTSQK